jgi:hypothetical protein
VLGHTLHGDNVAQHCVTFEKLKDLTIGQDVHHRRHFSLGVHLLQIPFRFVLTFHQIHMLEGERNLVKGEKGVDSSNWLAEEVSVEHYTLLRRIV